MSKFNPEDFKAPAMKPLSTITVNNESVEWDLIKNGLVAPHAKGWIRLMDEQTKALYEETSGFWFELKIKDDNIESNIESLRNGDSNTLEGAGKITEMDAELFSKPIEESFGEKDIVPKGNFYKECSCKLCGAPMSFTKVSGEVYAKAAHKGRSTENITEDELKRIFRIDSNHIDGVVYDNESTCTGCGDY